MPNIASFPSRTGRVSMEEDGLTNHSSGPRADYPSHRRIVPLDAKRRLLPAPATTRNIGDPEWQPNDIKWVFAPGI
jgi:hypothetical protein